MNSAGHFGTQSVVVAAAVLSHDGASDLFHSTLKKVEAARRQWTELTAFYPADRGRARRLILRHAPTLGKQIPVDELLMHAMTTAVDDDDD